MFINKNFTVRGLLTFSGKQIILLLLWPSLFVTLYHFTQWPWLSIPWLPISVIGTAVAFYVGFKNNQAYDRLWEARKIWGAIVNSSRAWGSMTRAFVSNHHSESSISAHDLKQHHIRLIYRHIAWLYQLREQLLEPTSWEHINQNGRIRRRTEASRRVFGLGLIDEGETKDKLRTLLDGEEHFDVCNRKNTATQLLDRQAQDLAKLHQLDLIDNFRHMELQKCLNDFYTHQGKCERIKKFPLPRQYANMSLVFVSIFIFLLPFGVVNIFTEDLGQLGLWVAIPFTALIGWVYMMMEMVGDYSENPFEGLGNDIPMLSLCRTIEIDLRDMLEEAELPKPVPSKNGVLM
ncbi:MAG: bestrophin family ion channel [Bacteroidota bacterium]